MRSLLPLANEWMNLVPVIGIPAIGATGIGDGYFNFLLLTLSPSEYISSYQNEPILVPPAALMFAGAMMEVHEGAAQNFLNTINELELIEDPFLEYGPVNYIDYNSGIPLNPDGYRGLLESQQGTFSLLNYLLGGSYAQDLLMQDPNWRMAIIDYATAIGKERIEGEDFISGNGMNKPRSQASGQTTRYISTEGDQLVYEIEVDQADEIWTMVFYSNDNFGNPDQLIIDVDGAIVDTIFTEDTGDFGAGWNIFTSTRAISLGVLSEGTHTITLELIDSNAGVEIDVIHFFSDWPSCPDYVEVGDLCTNTETINSIPQTNCFSKSHDWKDTA